MNETLDLLLRRHSVRAYDGRLIGAEARELILRAALRAPTAGNMMLYSIVEVASQQAKDQLAQSCDQQPFIARAPLVLLFLADYQRWYDYYRHGGQEEAARARGTAMQRPEEADLLLACCDALIAAQTSVVAAESLGIGSCYVGDIMENDAVHRGLFELPPYAFPICLLCYGYPADAERQRELVRRFDAEFIVFRDRYHRLSPDELERMFAGRDGQANYARKFSAGFMQEMRRSVRATMEAWRAP